MRQILAQVDRAAGVARSAVGAAATLRVGIIDSSYDSMPQILHEVQAHPGLVIHQVEAGVPGQYEQLTDGRGAGSLPSRLPGQPGEAQQRTALAAPQRPAEYFRMPVAGCSYPQARR